jgi:hypothetical protein
VLADQRGRRKHDYQQAYREVDGLLPIQEAENGYLNDESPHPLDAYHHRSRIIPPMTT